MFQHKDAYQVILDGVKGGTKEKRLAAQFIPKFFKHFPELADSAINAQLDLCEDEDVSVRLWLMLRQAFSVAFAAFRHPLCVANVPEAPGILARDKILPPGLVCWGSIPGLQSACEETCQLFLHLSVVKNACKILRFAYLLSTVENSCGSHLFRRLLGKVHVKSD